MISVAVSVIYNQEKKKFLIGRRAPTEPHSGYWEFPGGKLEKGETPEEALKRELMEELNVESIIRLKFDEHICKYGDKTYKLLTYFTEIDDSTLELRVHDKIEWVSLKEAYKYNMFPSNIKLLDKLCKYFNS